MIAEKGLLSSFRLGRKDDEQGSNSPFGGRKKADDKDAIDPSHPFGPPRRSGAEASKDAGGSPSLARKNRDSNSSVDTKDVLPHHDSEATDDTESSAQHDAPPASGAAPASASTPPAAAAAAPSGAPSGDAVKINVVVTVQATGQTQEVEYDARWQVRAVMANLATKLNVDKNSSLFHSSAHVFLEPQRELQCYWDLEPAALALTIVGSSKASTKETKVKFGSVKRSVHVMKQTTASGVVMLAGEETGFHPASHALVVSEKPVAPNTVVWKMIGSDWAVVPLTELAPVNLRVNFADDQVVKVLKGWRKEVHKKKMFLIESLSSCCWLQRQDHDCCLSKKMDCKDSARWVGG